MRAQTLRDPVGAKLAALHFYQLAIPAPKPAKDSFDEDAAKPVRRRYSDFRNSTADAFYKRSRVRRSQDAWIASLGSGRGTPLAEYSIRRTTSDRPRRALHGALRRLWK